ncbi:hypothetical protein HNY73_023118 [Argiope bruennichi]|uniref:Uncharacterized protein n=1 Tax=Argiope bruennichi TaxID=94029 RepID=A0A8T0E4N8_ARGBR|nr:hypothetical protein HNY73_023118 [Argiope bruennichi]
MREYFGRCHSASGRKGCLKVFDLGQLVIEGLTSALTSVDYVLLRVGRFSRNINNLRVSMIAVMFSVSLVGEDSFV